MRIADCGMRIEKAWGGKEENGEARSPELEYGQRKPVMAGG